MLCTLVVEVETKMLKIMLRRHKKAPGCDGHEAKILQMA